MVLNYALFRKFIFHFNACFRVINVILKKVYEPLGFELYIHKLCTETQFKRQLTAVQRVAPQNGLLQKDRQRMCVSAHV